MIFGISLILCLALSFALSCLFMCSYSFLVSYSCLSYFYLHFTLLLCSLSSCLFSFSQANSCHCSLSLSFSVNHLVVLAFRFHKLLDLDCLSHSFFHHSANSHLNLELHLAVYLAAFHLPPLHITSLRGLLNCESFKVSKGEFLLCLNFFQKFQR